MNFTSLNSHQSSSSYNDEDRIKRMNDVEFLDYKKSLTIQFKNHKIL